jgi:vitellogenic carboxypeptidase-like protein
MAAFQDAPRAVWRRRSGSGGGQVQKLAGYVQKHGALVHVAVYEAGHLVPAVQEMIEDWVFDKGMFGTAST